MSIVTVARARGITRMLQDAQNEFARHLPLRIITCRTACFEQARPLTLFQWCDNRGGQLQWIVSGKSDGRSRACSRAMATPVATVHRLVIYGDSGRHISGEYILCANCNADRTLNTLCAVHAKSVAVHPAPPMAMSPQS